MAEVSSQSIQHDEEPYEMATLPRIQESAASPEVRATYAKIKARYGGFLPEIYKAVANDPEYLDSLNDHMARVLAPRQVDARRRRSSRSSWLR